MSPFVSDTEEPLYQTDLTQTPFPDILVKIFRYKAPGQIECRRAEMVKRVYLERGHIIFATTNQIVESLGDRLVSSNRISVEQYNASLRNVRETGKRHGAVLVEMALLTPEELFVAVREQIEDILWSIFAWDFAHITFTPGRDKHLELVRIEIPVPYAVLGGVRHMPDPRALLARMGTRTTLLERSKEPLEDLKDVTLAPDEEELLAAATGKVPLSDLVNTGVNSASDNARILYGLYALGLVAPKEHVKVQVKASRPAAE